MSPTDVPTCPHCGSNAFTTGNASVVPGLRQHQFTCDQCKSSVLVIGHKGGAILAHVARDAMVEIDDRLRFPELLNAWVNDILLVAWRDREAKVKAHEELEWRKWLDEVFYPKFPDQTDYKPYGDKGLQELPADAQQFIHETFGGRSRPWQTGAYLPFPPTLDGPVYPPQAPDLNGLVLLFAMDDRWEYCDPEVSATLARVA